MTDMPAKHARPTHQWPLIFIASPAAVAVWSGWVALGGECGFGLVQPFPGILSWHLDTAITLPVGVEAYGAYALGIWLAAARAPERARRFARWSAIGALALGMLGQVIYHLLAAAHRTRAPWPVVVVVSCLPVVTLGFGAALTHLMRAPAPAPGEAKSTDGTEQATEATSHTAPVMAPQEAAPEAIQEATPRAIDVAPEQAIQEAIDGTPEEAIHEPQATPPGKPEAKPSSEPPDKPRATPPVRAKEATGLSREPDAVKARAAYRRSVQAGKLLTDRSLGAMFERGRTWGANRIKECEDGPSLAASPQSKEG